MLVNRSKRCAAQHMYRASLCEGISLVEVVVAVTVWTLSLVAVFGLINYSQLNIERASIIDELKKFTDKALAYYSEQIVQRQLYVGLQGVIPHGSAIFGGEMPDESYIFTIDIHPIDERIVRLEINVTGPKSTTYTEQSFVRIKQASIDNTIGGLDGSRDFSWCATPINLANVRYVRGVYTFDSETNITDVNGFADYIIVSTDDVKKSRPDLTILKASSSIGYSIVGEAGDPGNNDLELVNSYDTGLGVTAMSLDYPYLFLGTKSANEQLQIYDISMPAQAKLIATSSLRTVAATTTPVIRAIAYRAKDQTLHIGTEKWPGKEYNILDLSSTTQPILLGGLEIGSIVEDVYNTWPYTYISTGAQQQFMLVRTDNPVTLTNSNVLQSLSPPGWQVQEGSVIRRSGGQLWWGRTVGGFNNVRNHELFNFDVLSQLSSTSPDTLPIGPSYTVRSDFKLATSSDVGASVRDLIVGENYAIALTTSIGKEIMTYNVTRPGGLLGLNNSTSTFITSAGVIPLAGSPVKLWCNVNSIFVALNNPPRIVLLSTK